MRHDRLRTTAVSAKGPEMTSRGRAIARAQCRVADSQSCCSIALWRAAREDCTQDSLDMYIRGDWGLWDRAYLQFYDLADAFGGLADSLHLLVKRLDASTNILGRARGVGDSLVQQTSLLC